MIIIFTRKWDQRFELINDWFVWIGFAFILGFYLTGLTLLFRMIFVSKKTEEGKIYIIIYALLFITIGFSLLNVAFCRMAWDKNELAYR